MASLHHGVLDVLRGEALRLGDDPRDYDALLESAATCSLVLLAVTSEVFAIKTSIPRYRQNAWAAVTCIAQRVAVVRGLGCCHAVAGDAK